MLIFTFYNLNHCFESRGTRSLWNVFEGVLKTRSTCFIAGYASCFLNPNANKADTFSKLMFIRWIHAHMIVFHWIRKLSTIFLLVRDLCLGPVVQKLINVNPRLKILPRRLFLYSQLLFNADIRQNLTSKKARNFHQKVKNVKVKFMLILD